MVGIIVLGLPVLAIIAGLVAGLVLSDRFPGDKAGRLRDQARLKAIESQMAALRTALRVAQAEYRARQQMQAEAQDVFANPTVHEEPEEWR